MIMTREYDVNVTGQFLGAPIFNMTERPMNIASTSSDAMESGESTKQRWDISDDFTKSFKNIMSLYIGPLLLILGVAGNITSAVVFSRPALSKSPTSLYFRVLALADSLALVLGLLPNWLRDMKIVELFPQYDSLCRIKIYTKYLLPDYAVWVLVIMSVERVFGVYVPHKVRLVCTRRRIYYSLVVILIVLILLNLPVVVFTMGEAKLDNSTGELTRSCEIDADYEALVYDAWPWIDLLLYSLLPVSIMLFCNCTILVLLSSRRQHLQLHSTDSHMLSLTIILLTVSFVFILLTTPFALYSIITSSYPDIYGRQPNVVVVWYVTASYLRYVNNSANFPLYCLSGRPFRTELRYMCLCKSNPKVRYVSTTRTSVISARSSYSRSSEVY